VKVSGGEEVSGRKKKRPASFKPASSEVNRF
jgi:hypothetical protein